MTENEPRRCACCGLRLTDRDADRAEPYDPDDPPVYLCNSCRGDSVEWDDEEMFDEAARRQS